MNVQSVWSIPLAMAAAAILGPIATRAASRAFPPREGNTLEFAPLRAQYRVVELWSLLAAVFGMLGSLAFLIASRRNKPWLLGVIFGWLVLAPMLLIAVCTLPRGLARWRGFWRFYELHYGISMRFLAPVYAFICLLGIVSTAVILSRE
ncbi:MAG: hypothetical protein ACR2KT_15205 [Methylocella sp.]